MSVEHVFTPAAIFLNDDDASAETGLAGFASQGVTTGTEVRTVLGSSGLYETAASIVKQSPGLTFGTSQIKTAMEWVGGSYRCVKSVGGTKYGIDAFLQKHDECSARDNTDSQRYRFGTGLLVPKTLEVNHGEQATMVLELRPRGDASNAPMAVSEGIAFPATAPADQEGFTLYKQTVAGVDLTGCKGLQIDYGINVTEEMADGTTYPEWISVGSIITRATLRGINPRWLSDSAIPLGGKRMTHLNTKFRLAAYATADSGAYKDLTANHHIIITAAGLGYITTATSGSGSETTQTELQLICIHDGTNAPLGITLDTNLEPVPDPE